MQAAQEERDKILAILRRCAPALRTRGVRGLVLFGSLARGDADDHSDVDLAGEFDTAAGFSLLDLVRVEHDSSDLLGRRVDLVSLNGLKPLIRARVERDAIRAY